MRVKVAESMNFTWSERRADANSGLFSCLLTTVSHGSLIVIMSTVGGRHFHWRRCLVSANNSEWELRRCDWLKWEERRRKHQVAIISKLLTKNLTSKTKKASVLQITEFLRLKLTPFSHMRNQTASPTRPPISFWAHNLLPSIITNIVHKSTHLSQPSIRKSWTSFPVAEDTRNQLRRYQKEHCQLTV